MTENDRTEQNRIETEKEYKRLLLLALSQGVRTTKAPMLWLLLQVWHPAPAEVQVPTQRMAARDVRDSPAFD